MQIGAAPTTAVEGFRLELFKWPQASSQWALENMFMAVTV
jgi:hypothetical protein